MKELHDFIQSMREHDIIPTSEIIPNASHIKRFHVQGDSPGSKNGFYMLTIDRNSYGFFGCWKRTGGQHISWYHQKENITPMEMESLKKEIELRQKKHQEEKLAEQLQTAEVVDSAFAKLTDATETPYTLKKKITPFRAKQVGESLVLPLYDEDENIWSTQTIGPDGNKMFRAGGRTKGLFLLLGEVKESEEILICEGYATGCTLHELTRLPVAVAFTVGNLKDVCAHFQKNTITICADNDHKTRGNPGKKTALEIAYELKCKVVIPEGIEGTDFNDMFIEKGAEEVLNYFIKPGEIIPLNSIIKVFPILNKQGKPETNTVNLDYLCSVFGISFRKDLIRKTASILLNGEEDEHGLANLQLIMRSHNLDYRIAKSYVETKMKDATYNPVKEWIESRAWDGRERLMKFTNTIKTDGDPINEEMKEILIRKWMLTAVAQACDEKPVVSNAVLVLLGNQGLGKTRWLSKLVPHKLDLFKEGAILNHASKDSILEALRYWIVELGELDATFKKSDIAALKAFLGNTKDVIRLPYAAAASNLKRTTVFCASVNDDSFLKDPTGNRRYWVIDCKDIDHDHTFDMQQVWAEVYAYWMKGEQFYLNKEEMRILDDLNQKFEGIDPVKDAVLYHYDKYKNNSSEYVLLKDICFRLGFQYAGKAELNVAAKTLRSVGAKHKKSNGANLWSFPSEY